MEFKTITAFIVLVTVVNNIETRPEPIWPTTNILSKVTNKTALMINYVEEKEKKVKNYITEVISNGTTHVTEYVRRKGKQLNEYVGSVKRAEEYVIDVIRNKTNKYVGNAKHSVKSVLGMARSDNATDNGADKSGSDEQCSDEWPTIEMTTTQLIAYHGYFSESYTVITDDGYILTIHRIPYSKQDTNRKPYNKTVLLHHGIMGSSADWVLTGPDKSLAYILSDAGYDVWMANVRGNTYSRAHMTHFVSSFEFWNFTFHEVSQYDLPAVIDFILGHKGGHVKINYIGHSMGTSILFALLSTNPEYNKVLRAGFALAPIAFMADVKSPVKYLSNVGDNIESMFKTVGSYDFLTRNAIVKFMTKNVCDDIEKRIYKNIFFVICGYDEGQFNRSLLPVILGHMPAGTSVKTLAHYAQQIRDCGKFQQYDYGAEGNILQYGTREPPEYPVHNITLPIALFSSENDLLSSISDAKKLYKKLRNPIEHYIVPHKEFNHLDFLWAKDANRILYNRLLELLNKDL